MGCWAASRCLCFSGHSLSSASACTIHLTQQPSGKRNPSHGKLPFPSNLRGKPTHERAKGLTHSFHLSKRQKDEGQARHEKSEGKQRRWLEKYSGDRGFGLRPTEPVWNLVLSGDRNGKNVASLSVKKIRELTASYTVVNLAQYCSKN